MVSIRYRSGSWNLRWRQKGPNGEVVEMSETYADPVQAGTRKYQIELSRVESRYNRHGLRREHRNV